MSENRPGEGECRKQSFRADLAAASDDRSARTMCVRRSSSREESPALAEVDLLILSLCEGTLTSHALRWLITRDAALCNHLVYITCYTRYTIQKGQAMADYDPANPMGITDEEMRRIPEFDPKEFDEEQCPAAHEEDRRACVGNLDALRVVDAGGETTYACVLHGAVALASVTDARAIQGNRSGAAIAAYELAKTLEPNAWRGEMARERAAELYQRHVGDLENFRSASGADLARELYAKHVGDGELVEVISEPPLIDDEDDDFDGCPNCGAPTGGGAPCTWRGNGMSCHDLMTLEHAYDEHDWDQAKRIIAEIKEFNPGQAAELWKDYLNEYSNAENAKRGVAVAQARVDAKKAQRERLCAHADDGGRGMHWLKPGEVCDRGHAQDATEK